MAFNSFGGGTGGGGNPRYGRDSNGPLPPATGFPTARPMPYYTTAMPGGWPYAQPQYIGHVPMTLPGNQVYLTAAPPNSAQIPMINQQPALTQGQGPQPALDRNFRTCSMRNTTGGFGCEPGYNYFFPAEHTKIHVLKTGPTPPWQLPPNFAIQFHATHVPVNTTVAELMKGFGAKNPLPKKNIITEVCPGGGGKWYKGIEVSGDNLDMMKKPIKELGWDGTRTGLRGQKKVVYVYVQRG
ncbi:hypothetical protein SPBR_06178 [Sporothrix brasiliensis 5110]|uniref:Uncharacterized protein n=1 Tax=Sporothrix brasiliensis 5110 TaxID=1398154 RepID=A0A0C2IXG0_9PEZI|nr:uncharacterized protein SPBR_06178 [Sporothrix brasiliensis 5110]KIH93816.1 hypothetical protein SPBR_06178 [Sporothrix brasiliensis 5110]